MEILILSLVAFVVAVLTFFSGFGLGTILTPVFMVFFPVDLAIALTGVVHFFNNLFKLALVGRKADRSVAIRFGVPAVVAAFFGAWLMLRMSNLPVLFVLSHATKSYADELAYVLRMGKSSNPEYRHDHLFLKMNGRKLYEYALKAVPQTMKECIDQAGLSVSEVNKVLIHQANEKMDEAILRNLFELYGLNSSPKDMMPMTISWLGNSSVATLPTLYDLMHKGKLIDQALQKGSVVVFASMGAGVNMNAVAYKIPTA